jgi:hypothetical protein
MDDFMKFKEKEEEDEGCCIQWKRTQRREYSHRLELGVG